MATCASGQAIFAKWLRPCATRKSPRSHRSIARLPRKISAQNWKLLARPAIFLLVCWWRDGRKESASRWEPRLPPPRNGRSEERRVGKECRARGRRGERCDEDSGDNLKGE